MKQSAVTSSTTRFAFSMNRPHNSSLHQQCSHSATPMSISAQTKDSCGVFLKGVFSLFFHLTQGKKLPNNYAHRVNDTLQQYLNRFTLKETGS